MATFDPILGKEEERLREQKRREELGKKTLERRIDRSREAFIRSGIDSFFNYYQKKIENDIGFHDE
jgi:hypothetical protein